MSLNWQWLLGTKKIRLGKVRYGIFRVDYSIFNCSKINPVGEIRHSYLVLVEALLRWFQPSNCQLDEEVIWTLGFHNIALFPLWLAKRNSSILKHACISLIFYFYLKVTIYLLASPVSGITENNCLTLHLSPIAKGLQLPVSLRFKKIRTFF